MIPSQRHDEILRQLDKHEKVRISDLQELLHVTDMTIRRDLDHLEQKGMLERIRGGAAKIQRINSEYLFSQKNIQMKSEKIAIGKVVPQFIKENDTVFINSGSTVLQAAMELKGFSLKIITNNPMLTLLDLGDKISLVLLGGEFRKESHSLVGETAINILSQIYATKCIIGVDGLSMRYGLTNSTFVEASLNRKMIEQTRGKVIVVADHTKIGRVGPFLISPIDNIDILITTKGFPEEYFEQLINKGIKIIVANE
jgi:DeoR family fructose operon transcriptional repressor